MQLADHDLTTPTAYIPQGVDVLTEQHRLRVLVDELAIMRGLMIQMAVKVMSYTACGAPNIRHDMAQQFVEMNKQFNRKLALIFGSGPFEDIPTQHLTIIRCAARRDPARHGLLLGVAGEIDRIALKLTSDAQIDFTAARHFFEANWTTVRDQMTQVIWEIWADIDNAREKELQIARAAAHALGERLKRLEHIGKHVRLVSLSASVEAARAGDAGKGLMVIAHEFKSLAEEIQSLAKDARADVGSIS